MTWETTPPLRPRSPRVRRQRERLVGFEEAPNREGSRAGRNVEGSRPSEIEARENRNRGMNLPPLLTAHLGRNESGQPLQSSLTSVYVGHQPSTNIGGISLLTLELLGENISQEDVNQKLLRSLSPEWNTHAVVWRNKADLDTMSMDDLFLHTTKVYEQKLKGFNVANSTNIDNLSDVVICSFFASQPNSPQLVHEDLQQIHLDDMEEMDLNRQYGHVDLRQEGRVLQILQEEHFCLGCQSSKKSDNKNKEKIKKECALQEISTSTALVSCDGLGGYDWSDQAKDGLIMQLWLSHLSNSDLGGLKSMEEKLEVYEANESIYLQDIKGLKFEIHLGEIAIRKLRKKLEIVQKEKDGIQINVDKFKHASKSLNKLIECQIVDNYKKGLDYKNYNAVSPLYTENFMPPTPDLSFTGLDEFVNEPVVENCKAMSSKKEPKVASKNDDAPIIKEWVSNDEENDMSQPKIEKKTVRPSIVKKEFGNSQIDLQDQGVIDSGCSRHMTRNMSYLTNYEEIDGVYVAFGENPKGGKITRKCTIKTGNIDVEQSRTPSIYGVAERRNRTLIEVARTMLADSKLPTTFLAEAVNTACYVQNRVLVVKPHNKTPYELFHGRTPTLSFMRPFGCPVTILNTIDHLGKFDGKADEGFFVGYSLNSKAFRVFNSRTRIVEENLHIRFSTQSNGFVGTKASDNAGQARKETEPVKDYILLPLWTADPPYSQDPKSSHDDGSKPSNDDGKKVDEDKKRNTNEVYAVGGKTSIELPFDPNMPALEDYSIFDFSRNDEDDGAEADINNLDTTIQVSPIPTTRIHKDHPLDQVIGDLQSATQTRKMSNNLKETMGFS
ncbi:retrovirus-related pol polyprotein from transposon TNT 1-94 [Tanacetum coccineum]